MALKKPEMNASNDEPCPFPKFANPAPKLSAAPTIPLCGKACIGNGKGNPGSPGIPGNPGRPPGGGRGPGGGGGGGAWGALRPSLIKHANNIIIQ